MRFKNLNVVEEHLFTITNHTLNHEKRTQGDKESLFSVNATQLAITFKTTAFNET